MSDFYYSLMYAVIPITACIIDTVYGDPRSNFHPVVLIGNLISYIENKLYPKKPALPKDLMLRGLLTVCLVLLTVGIFRVPGTQRRNSSLFFAECVDSLCHYYAQSPCTRWNGDLPSFERR